MADIPTRLFVLVKFLGAEEGGREHVPVLKGYPPHLVVPPDPHRLGVIFTDGPDCFEAGEEVRSRILCIYEPEVSYASLKAGTCFEILEGAQVVGRGIVLPNSSGKCR